MREWRFSRRFLDSYSGASESFLYRGSSVRSTESCVGVVKGTLICDRAILQLPGVGVIIILYLCRVGVRLVRFWWHLKIFAFMIHTLKSD